MGIVRYIGVWIVAMAMTVSAAQVVDIESDQFEFDGKTNKILATGGVTVTQGEIVLKSPRALYEKAKQIIQLLDGVHITHNELKMTCDSATAFGLEDKVDAVGRVHYTYKDIVGDADRAVYDITKQTIVLTGSPITRQGEDQLVAEMVIVDLKSKKVITKGKAKVKLSVEKLKPR